MNVQTRFGPFIYLNFIQRKRCEDLIINIACKCNVIIFTQFARTTKDKVRFVQVFDVEVVHLCIVCALRIIWYLFRKQTEIRYFIVLYYICIYLKSEMCKYCFVHQYLITIKCDLQGNNLQTSKYF